MTNKHYLIENLNTIILTLTAGFSGWYFTSIKSKNEKKKLNFENINESFQAIIESQNKLMLQNSELIQKLITKESEIIDLKNKVYILQKKINSLYLKFNIDKNEH